MNDEPTPHARKHSLASVKLAQNVPQVAPGRQVGDTFVVVHSDDGFGASARPRRAEPPRRRAEPPPQPVVSPPRQVEPRTSTVADEEDGCRVWNCTCQGLTDKFFINHRLKSYGLAPEYARRWWGKHKCSTSLEPSLRRPAPRQKGAHLAAADQVCYFLPTRPGDGRRETILETWGRDVRDRLFFMMSLETDNTSYVDLDKNEVHVAFRNFTDSTGRVVPEYEPEELPGWQAPLVAKMMKIWEFMSMTYYSHWAHRCAWFVKTDDDSWLNTHLLEQRLRCMDPDSELNFGYSCGFGVGVYTGYSRRVVENFAYFIQHLRTENEPKWFTGDIEDRRIGQVLMRFGIFISRGVTRNGTASPDLPRSPDFILWHKTWTPEMRLQWVRDYARHIGCIVFTHNTHPPVMRELSRLLWDRVASGEELCKGWRTQGLERNLREQIEKGCPDRS